MEMRRSVDGVNIDIDCIVIGAGVVGLAVARTLSLHGREVIVLEAAPAIGTGISSRNSEVIHAGLYYAPDSRKARHCVRGRAMLYAYCETRGIPHKRLGKLVVARDESEVAALEAIAARAARNGVDDLRFIDRAQIAALEPALSSHAALHSPSTGIIDTHALMLSLLGELEDNGAALALDTPVVSGEVWEGGVEIVTGGAEPARIVARCVVNCAGLAATDVASRVAGLAAAPPQMRFAKGNYFGMTGRVPFSRLVYPVPEPGGLGVHVTLDMGGRARFGPDVEWIDEIDFNVDPARATPFYEAIRRYWPGLPDGSLYPDYCGIRPKPVEGDGDFIIDVATPGIISLYGIESPGLTSSLSIADEVASAADEVFG